MKDILFLCDGKQKCCKKLGCGYNGGECFHTINIKHAKNFQKMIRPKGYGGKYYLEVNN